MAETLKVLGQSAPSATTLTDLYTVPSSTQTTVSTVYVCNHNATKIVFRIAIAVAGAADTAAQYLYRDSILPANSSFAATVGLTLGATDVIRVRTDTANVSFSAFGAEVT